MAQRRKPETEDQFLRRIDRTAHKKVKDGGPTSAELVRAIGIKTRRIAADREAAAKDAIAAVEGR